MTRTPTLDSDKLKQSSADAVEQLTSAFAAYSEISDRMQQSYVQLQAEVQRLRGELAQKNELLERKSRLAALGEMAAGMAHEIRNPLGAVQLYASLLERDLRELPDQVKLAQKIGNAVCSLDLIVNDILVFTQDQACEISPVHLYGLVADVVSYVLPTIADGQVHIDISQIDRDCTVEVDVNLMHRVFMNLIRNAVEAVDGCGTVKVTAEAEPEDSEFRHRICVADDGCGIELELMSKIFNPFFTTKGVGTGLGLAIVHRLIECHSGVISVAKNGERGTVFTILLY